jgi:ubiquitin-protein ligase
MHQLARYSSAETSRLLFLAFFAVRPHVPSSADSNRHPTFRMEIASPSTLSAPLPVASSDSQPAKTFEDLWFTVFDPLVEQLSSPSLSILAACSHGTDDVFGNATLWAARFRARAGEEVRLTMHPRRMYARLDVCERWRIKKPSGAGRSRGALCSPTATAGKGKENVAPTPRTELSSRRRPVLSSPLAPRSAAASPLDKCQSVRLRKDLFELMTQSAGPVTAFPERETDLSSWLARVTCPKNGAVHGGITFSFRLQYSGPGAEGAESLPAVSVLAPACYHPNVDAQCGTLCPRALRQRCTPLESVGRLLHAVLELLQVPCFAVAPVNKAAAADWYDGPEELRHKARDFTYLEAKLHGLKLH